MMTTFQGNTLAAKVSRAMSGPGDLMVLDSATKSWSKHPWQEVHAKAEAIAEHALARAQGEIGVVGLVGEPTVDMVAAIQAAWLAGTSVSVFPGPQRGADPAQWAQATLGKLASIGAKTVYSNGGTLELLRGAGAPVRVEGLAEAGAKTRSTGFTPVVNGDDETPGVLQSTAGSTGTSKTAVVSRRALLANTGGFVSRLGLAAERDVSCSWLPLYHDLGLMFLFTSMTTGVPLWLASNTAFAAAPLQWLRWLDESRATCTMAPNFAYDIVGRFGKRIEGVDLGGLRVALSGGESINCEGFDRFVSAVGRFGFDPAAARPGYGLAESTCAVTLTGPGQGLRDDEVVVDVRGEGERPTRRYALLGEPVDGAEVRVVPLESNEFEVAGREVGEVEVRGASMMSGYFGDDEVTPDQWFKTGDVGYLLDGQLVVIGRVKELIVVAGRNIFPAEVERVVEKVEGVRTGCVAAVGTGERAARPGLAIAAEYRGSDQSAARSQVVERVASECGVVPAEVVFLEPGFLPKTTSGKLRRLEVKRYLESAGEAR